MIFILNLNDEWDSLRDKIIIAIFFNNIILRCYSSGVIWEQCKMGSRRYKVIEGPKAIQIEEAYQKYKAQKMVADNENEVSPRYKIDEKIEVCYLSQVYYFPDWCLQRCGLFWLRSSGSQQTSKSKMSKLRIYLFPILQSWGQGHLHC